MKRYQTAGLWVVAITAVFWAFVIIDELLNNFRGEATFIDFGVVFVLGLISGLALGVLLSVKRSRPETA